MRYKICVHFKKIRGNFCLVLQNVLFDIYIQMQVLIKETQNKKVI